MIDHTRHEQIFDAKNISVTLIGGGGIGALTALVLAKMGVARLTIYDGDLVGPENIATQWLRLSDVGIPKVTAIRKQIYDLAGEMNVVTKPYKVEGERVRDYIVISAVDSITSRQKIWPGVQAGWYIDARMSAEIFHLHTINMEDPDQVSTYSRQLGRLREEDVPEEVCTAKATIYTAALAAAYIGNAVKSIIVNGDHPNFLAHNLPTQFLMVS